MWRRKSSSEFRHVDTAELVRMYDSYVKQWEETTSGTDKHTMRPGEHYIRCMGRIAEELDRRVK
jgi:hypothetical protein